MLAGLAIGGVVILSLAPGGWQERTGLPPRVEHVIGYFAVALLLGWAWPGDRQALKQVALLVGLASAMELLQNFSPGRDPTALDVIVSSLAAMGGSAVALAINRYRAR